MANSLFQNFQEEDVEKLLGSCIFQTSWGDKVFKGPAVWLGRYSR